MLYAMATRGKSAEHCNVCRAIFLPKAMSMLRPYAILVGDFHVKIWALGQFSFFTSLLLCTLL